METTGGVSVMLMSGLVTESRRSPRERLHMQRKRRLDLASSVPRKVRLRPAQDLERCKEQGAAKVLLSEPFPEIKISTADQKPIRACMNRNTCELFDSSCFH